MGEITDRISLENGKYIFYIKDHSLYCDRNGEPWRNFIGDKAIYGLFNKVIELTQPKMTKEWVFKKIKERYSEAQLDSDVHVAKSNEASKINNGEIHVQLEYLEQSNGLDWLIQTYLDI